VLSDRERRALQELEHALAVDDPRLAERLRSGPTGRRRALGGVAIVLAVAVALLCFTLSAVAGGLVAGAVAVAVAVALLLHRRRRTGPGRWSKRFPSDDGPAGSGGQA
jgi:protein-S-isoprenylcysteine O-methyltransferase Ste14